MTTEHSSKVSLDTTVKLTGRRDWPQWYSTLQYLARAKDVWKYINPDEEGSNEILKPEELPTPEVFIKKRNYQLQKDYEKRLKTWTARHEAPETNTQDDTVSQVPSGERPSPPDLVTKQTPGIFDEYAAQLRYQAAQQGSLTKQERACELIDSWVSATVDQALLVPARMELLRTNEINLRNLITALKRKYAPNETRKSSHKGVPQSGGTEICTDLGDFGAHADYYTRTLRREDLQPRIWVPSLGQVIITRNVTFDENRFYSPDDVDAEPKTSTATQIVEEIRETESSLNPILEALGVIDSAEQTLIQATQPPPAVLEPNQEATRDVVPTEETGQEKDEGWLLTPDPTPEPESVPDSGGPTSETGDSSTTPLLEPSTERDTAAAVSDAEDVIYVRTEEDEGASTDIRSGNDLQPRPIMANQYDKVEEHETYLQKTETEKGTPHEDDMYTNSTRLSCLISRKPRKKRTTDTRLCTTSFRVLFTARSILA
nr:reverse transcriptase domain protein [Colletotrichum truncatum]KAF6786960.1 reverse transcriptase domain protein [Colletotrichum truncatum]